MKVDRCPACIRKECHCCGKNCGDNDYCPDCQKEIERAFELAGPRNRRW